ncbi:MAG: restriction endonuclease subunit S [Myxococcota bacterium]
MTGKWREVTIESIASRIAMGPFGSDIKTDNFVPSGVPVIRGHNLTRGRFRGEEFVFLTQEKADELSNANAFPGDLVFTHRGTLGQVGLIPPAPFERYVVSQSQMKLTCDPDSADALFIYYFFTSPIGQHALLMNTSQTGVPAISRPVTSLKAIQLSLPPLPEQRAIAHILGTLDDKIELNRRMSETLEALARTLFKSWFVDFDPARAKSEGRGAGLPKPLADLFPDAFEDSELGEIPKGWAVEPLDQIARFQNGLALQKHRPKDGEGRLPVVKIAQLRSGRADSGEWASANLKPECIIDDGDVVFSWSGSLLVKIWAGGRAALNQHLFRVTSEKYPRWFFLDAILSHLPEFRRIAAGKATTMGHIQRHHLTSALCVVPGQDLLRAVTPLFSSLLDRSVENDVQSRTLGIVRDTLLRKLISGELRIEDAERLLSRLE